MAALKPAIAICASRGAWLTPSRAGRGLKRANALPTPAPVFPRFVETAGQGEE
jgi:hypothetical protein